MKIYGIKCREVMACAGSWAVVAEAEVEIENGEEIYVTAQEYDGLELTVSKQSLYAFLVGNGQAPAEEFVEEYRAWKDTKESAYAEVFARLKKVMKMMGGC